MTPTETGTNTETETGKMTTVPNGISVSVQYERPHTNLYKQFLSVQIFVSVNYPLVGSDDLCLLFQIGAVLPNEAALAVTVREQMSRDKFSVQISDSHFTNNRR